MGGTSATTGAPKTSSARLLDRMRLSRRSRAKALAMPTSSPRAPSRSARPVLEFGALTPAGLTAAALAFSKVRSWVFGAGVDLYCCRACSAAVTSALAAAWSGAFLAGMALRRARAPSTWPVSCLSWAS